LKDVDPRVFTRMLQQEGRKDGRTDGSVTISLRNFVGEGIKRKSNTMAKGRRTSNTMAKIRRTSNTMVKRRRTSNTMAKRRTSNDLQNISIKLKIE